MNKIRNQKLRRKLKTKHNLFFGEGIIIAKIMIIAQTPEYLFLWNIMQRGIFFITAGLQYHLKRFTYCFRYPQYNSGKKNISFTASGCYPL